MRTRLQQSSGDPVSRIPPQGGEHRSVLLHEAIDSLAIVRDDVVVDATLGGAGHAKELARRLSSKGVFIGFDLDRDAIERAQKALEGIPAQVHLIEANFRNLKKELEARGIERISKVLFDLGWSSYQLDSGRGFSLRADEPLLMTYTKGESAVTAARIVNEWKEETIADIIYGFGEERYSRRIARAIVERRETKPFSTANELAEVIARAVPAAYARGRIHPATRTFQALRIAVNDELGSLQAGLSDALDLLTDGGLIAVISFHSVEDRTVKQFFAERERKGEGRRLTKKPIVPSETELQENRRARSAKLRVFQKKAYDAEDTQDKQAPALDPSGHF